MQARNTESACVCKFSILTIPGFLFVFVLFCFLVYSRFVCESALMRACILCILHTAYSVHLWCSLCNLCLHESACMRIQYAQITSGLCGETWACMFARESASERNRETDRSREAERILIISVCQFNFQRWAVLAFGNSEAVRGVGPRASWSRCCPIDPPRAQQARRDACMDGK